MDSGRLNVGSSKAKDSGEGSGKDVFLIVDRQGKVKKYDDAEKMEMNLRGGFNLKKGDGDKEEVAKKKKKAGSSGLKKRKWVEDQKMPEQGFTRMADRLRSSKKKVVVREEKELRNDSATVSEEDDEDEE